MSVHFSRHAIAEHIADTLDEAHDNYCNALDAYVYVSTEGPTLVVRVIAAKTNKEVTYFARIQEAEPTSAV